MRWRILAACLFGTLLLPARADAGRITLAWDPSPDAVAGYTIFYGTSSGNHPWSVDTTQATHTITGLTPGVRYYFIVKAFNSSRVYSAPSNEVNGLPANTAPTIENPGTRTTRSGLFILQIDATDADGDALVYSATGLPSGLSIDPSTGVIAGTVVAGGSYGVTVTVSDGALQASVTFALVVTTNSAPTLQTPQDQTHDLDDVVSLQLSASDPDGDVLTYSASGLPPGLSLNSAAGLIIGTPTAIGTYPVTVTVADQLLSTSRTFSWTVVPLPPPVPISRWTFDEGSGNTAADIQGSRTGTLTNGASWASGRFGAAVLLDGTNDYVALPTFSVSGSALTIAAWVRTNSFGTGEQRFISKTGGSTTYWSLGTNGTSLLFRLRAGGSNRTLTSPAILQANSWYHAVATYDGSTMRLYLNGAQVAATGKSGSLSTGGTSAVAIGRNPGSASQYFNGAIDDVRMYSRALTAAEVSALYNEPPSPNPEPEPDPAPAPSRPPPPAPEPEPEPEPPSSFTDDPLVPGKHTFRLVHILELRTRIDRLRQARGLSEMKWTPLEAKVSPVRAGHIQELRAALNAVYDARKMGRPTYDGGLAAGMPIKAAHIMELRAAVRALE